MFRQRVPVFALMVAMFLLLIFALARISPPPPAAPSSSVALMDDGNGSAATVTYLINRRSEEVHTLGCRTLPAEHNRVYLGEFSRCQEAVAEAKRRGFAGADGCGNCSRPCHFH